MTHRLWYHDNKCEFFIWWCESRPWVKQMTRLWCSVWFWKTLTFNMWVTFLCCSVCFDSALALTRGSSSSWHTLTSCLNTQLCLFESRLTTRRAESQHSPLNWPCAKQITASNCFLLPSATDCNHVILHPQSRPVLSWPLIKEGECSICVVMLYFRHLGGVVGSAGDSNLKQPYVTFFSVYSSSFVARYCPVYTTQHRGGNYWVISLTQCQWFQPFTLITEAALPLVLIHIHDMIHTERRKEQKAWSHPAADTLQEFLLLIGTLFFFERGRNFLMSLMRRADLVLTEAVVVLQGWTCIFQPR